MKKLLKKSAVFAAVLLLVYLALLLAGIFTVYNYPIHQRKSFFYSMAEQIAQEFTEGRDDTLREMIGPNTRICIYDAEGRLLLEERPTASGAMETLSFSPDGELRAVLQGKRLYYPRFTSWYQRTVIVAGVPVFEDETVVGGVILMRMVMDLPEAATAFVLFYTIAYIAAVCFFLLDRRRKRAYERLRQTYIANVTHALKAPIASVKVLTETLSEIVEPDPNLQSVYYGMILREVNLQNRMVQEILELSRLQSNDMDFTRTAVNAADIFERIREKYETLCECMDISLKITDAALKMPPLDTNAACLNQVLDILMDNALKFVDEGGEIQIDASISRRRATVCVLDNGRGIAKEDLPHIFERFYKAGGKRNESGSGLGLAIAKEIVEGLKERIWAESEPGRGAAFFFTVRLR